MTSEYWAHATDALHWREQCKWPVTQMCQMCKQCVRHCAPLRPLFPANYPEHGRNVPMAGRPRSNRLGRCLRWRRTRTRINHEQQNPNATHQVCVHKSCGGGFGRRHFSINYARCQKYNTYLCCQATAQIPRICACVCVCGMYREYGVCALIDTDYSQLAHAQPQLTHCFMRCI